MSRRPLRMRFGEVPFEVRSDGRVVELPAGVLAMPEPSAPLAEYPCLKAFLKANR